MAVIRQQPTALVLSNLYDIIRKTIQDADAYYTDEQIMALKENPNNVFIKDERKTK